MAEGMPLDLVLFFSTGFLISLGHCIGMCGPLVGAFSLAQRPSNRSAWHLTPALLLYHTGRLAAYGFLGLAFGLLGSATQIAGRGQVLQGGLSLFAGCLMGLLGLGLLGWLPTQRWVESSRLGEALASRLARVIQRQDPGTRVILGLGNGFLPCGPVYAMATGTMAAANPLLGAAAMIAYGAGTVPILLGVGLGAGRINPKTQSWLNRLGVLLVLLIGLQLVLRGAAALGWLGHLKWGEFVFW
jgi:sulfite exporter TauE/SafE